MHQTYSFVHILTVSLFSYIPNGVFSSPLTQKISGYTQIVSDPFSLIILSPFSHLGNAMTLTIATLSITA